MPNYLTGETGDDIDQEALNLAVNLLEDPGIKKGGVVAEFNGQKVVVLCGLARGEEDEDEILLVPWAILMDRNLADQIKVPPHIAAVMYDVTADEEKEVNQEDGEDRGGS